MSYQLSFYAPRASPQFTGDVIAPSRMAVIPRNATDDTFAEIVFFKNQSRASFQNGDAWSAGLAAHNVGERNFAIGCNGVGSVMTLLPTGEVRIPGTVKPGE